MSVTTKEAREVLGRLRARLINGGEVGARERATLAEFIAASLEWEEDDEPDFAAFALSAAGGHLGAQVDELLAVNARLLAACKAAEKWLEGWASAEPYLREIRAAIDLASAEPAPDLERAVNARRELREGTR